MSISQSHLGRSICVATAVLLSACAPVGLLEQHEKASLAKTDQLLAIIDGATRDGLSVVLVPAIAPQKDITDLSLFSHSVMFQNKDLPDQHYMQAFANNLLEKNEKTAYLWDFLEVHIVAPGTYLMAGGIDYKLQGSLAQVGAPRGQASTGKYGKVNISAVLYRQFNKETYWRDARYESTTQSQTVCTAVLRASGQCVAQARQNYTTTEKVADAGWAEGTRADDLQSLKIQADILPEYSPIRFTIEPGQILLSDRFHLKTPAIKYDSTTCKAPDSQHIDCALQDIVVYIKPAPMEFTQGYIDEDAPGLNETSRKVLSRIQAMKTLAHGVPGMDDVIWGTPVSLRK